MALLATVAYAVVDALSKYQARNYPVGMIVWVRYAVPLLVLLGIYLPRRGRSLFRTAYPGVQLARGILLTAGTVFIVFAYRLMPLAEAQAISFIHPVLLTVLAVIFLGEKVGAVGWCAVLVGFSGVLIIVRPGGGMLTAAAILPLGLALSFSSYQMLTRLIAPKESSVNLLFCAMLVGTVSMTLALPLQWKPPTLEGFLFFVAIGLSSGVGHFSTIKALELAPASLLAPFAYIQLVWVTVLGSLFFGDFPKPITILGMAVVVAGGLLVAASRRSSEPR